MNANYQELALFNKACGDLANGKYLLIDVKINSILNSIENDEKLKNLVSSCVNLYPFTDLFNAATSTGSFICPNDDKQVISLVYNLLYRLKTKDIDFYEFLEAYFANAKTMDEKFLMFSKNIVNIFQTSVGNIFVKRHVIVDSSDYQNNYYNKIKTTVSMILKNMDSFKITDNDKEEYKMLLNSLYLASDKNDKTLVYSLMIAIDYFTKYHKKIRKTYLALEECFC